MTSLSLDRRTMIAAAGMTAAVAAAGDAIAQSATPPAVKPVLPPKPLPFAPASVGWLSEKLIVSHHDNNYAGAVKRLDAIHGELGKLDVAKAPGFLLNGLKREELLAWNSAILHELYFAGLSGGEKPSAKLAATVEPDFGSHAAWAGEFSAMGKALGGGSGWVLLMWNDRDARLVNQWAADHTMALAGGTPLLALDMYEHAYHMDFGAKAGAYVDAFMGGFSWGTANRLFGKT